MLNVIENNRVYCRVLVKLYCVFSLDQLILAFIERLHVNGSEYIDDDIDVD